MTPQQALKVTNDYFTIKRHLQPFGVTLGMVSVLSIVNNKSSVVSIISKATGMKQPLVCLCLEKLIKRGFISYNSAAGNYSITAPGRQQLEVISKALKKL